MTSKCACCGTPIKRNNPNLYIDCDTCRRMFQTSCVNLSKNELDIFRKLKQKWSCGDCEKSKRLKRNDESTIQDDLQDTTGNAEQVVENDNCFFDFDPNDVGKMLLCIYNQLKENTKQSSNLCMRFDSLSEAFDTIKNLKAENKVLHTRISILESTVDNYEQSKLEKSIDIIGLPVAENENVVSSVQQLFDQRLTMTVPDDEIVKCFRLPSRNDIPGKIIVNFRNKNTRDAILRKMNNIKKLPVLDGIGNIGKRKSLIYVNASLTKYRRILFQKAKEFKAIKGYKYVWLRDSTIMLRKVDGGRIIYLNSLDDLDKL